MKCLTETTH